MTKEKDYQNINNFIKQLLLKEYPTSRIKVNSQQKIVMINGNMYRFSITNNLGYSKINLKKIQMKSNRGKVQSKNSQKFLTKLAMMATVVGIGSGALLVSSLNERNAPPSIQIERPTEIPKETLAHTIVIETDISKENIAEEQTITLFKEINYTNDLGYEKKENTIKEFGSTIEEYSNRYGLDYNLNIALFTQERSNDPTSANYQNVGQITESVSGENIVAPVFNNGKLCGQDKIYILPRCYNQYPLQDLETMANFPSFSEKEQSKIKEAIKRKNEGYEIYRLIDVKTDASLNIKVSCAYLSYLINKQQNLVKGIASYNMGYPRINQNVSEESILKGEIREANDPNYLTNIFQYLSEEEIKQGFTIHYENGETLHYNIESVDYEKETEHSIRR